MSYTLDHLFSIRYNDYPSLLALFYEVTQTQKALKNLLLGLDIIGRENGKEDSRGEEEKIGDGWKNIEGTSRMEHRKEDRMEEPLVTREEWEALIREIMAI